MCNRDFVLDHALGWRKLAIFSAVSVLITQPINGLVQTNAVSSSIEEAFGVPQWITVWIVVILLTITVLGGLKRISHIAETLVPFMCVMYIVAVVILLALNWRNIPMAFASIFKYAFTPMSAVGGFVGASVQQAFRYGIARGLFSNDSGVGAALCAHAPAKTDHPARQACWGWGENFVDTLIVCTCTALAILCTDIYILRPDITGVQLSTAAFGQTFGRTGSSFPSITVSLFAWTTLLGTYYQTEKSLNYLMGDKNKYKWVAYIWMASYILLQFLGTMDATLLWALADLSGVIKVLITLTLIVMLRKEIFRLNTDFFDRYLPALKRGENPAPVIYGDYDSTETAGDGQSAMS